MTARSAFLAGLVDYAGLFPPAALPLALVVETYGRERVGAEAAMLGRLIVPAGRLGELDAFRKALATGTPWRLSVLGLTSDGETADAWLAAAHDTLAAAASADARLGTASDRFELRLPAALARDADALAAALLDLHRALPEAAAVALEVPYLAAPDATAPAAHAIAEVHARLGTVPGEEAPASSFALKLRCGGETPDAIPPVEALAAALTTARQAGVAVKATAGLHHPLRGMADVAGAPMHGFVNVFGGAALAACHGLDADTLAEVLDDPAPARWRLDDVLAYRTLAAEAPAVAQARTHTALSFGSCSFGEPRDDLRTLGWL